MRVKREKSTTTVRHYVKNADLLPAVIEAKQLGVVTDKLISMIQLIAENYSKKHSFVNYSFREDMVSTAVENLCKNALKFNHEKFNNPFAFYTTAIHNSFLQYMNDEKKHRNIRDALLIDAGANPSFNFLQGERDDGDSSIRESDTYDFSSWTPSSSAETADKDLVDAASKIRYRDRVPGQAVKYSAGEMIFDDKLGYFVKKV